MHRVTLLCPRFIDISDITQSNNKMRATNFYLAPKIGAVSYLPTPVIYVLSAAIGEQLRSLRESTGKEVEWSTWNIASERRHCPKSRIRRIRKYAWACKELFTLLGERNRNPDVDEGNGLGRWNVVTEQWHFRCGICSKAQKEKARRNEPVC